jgi:DeoR family deoxyribose operon repressor
VKKQEKRLRDIIDYLKGESGASTRELSQKLGVTEMTIRRDLSALADRNQVRVIHGGAIYTGGGRPAGDERYFFHYEETLNKEMKKRIGEKAASHVEEGDTIVLDGGSTVEYVARCIPRDLELTILCYSLNVLNIVARIKNWRKIFAGGYYDHDSLFFQSAKGVELIRSMRATKAFIGAMGVNQTLGLTSKNLIEVETKKAVIDSTDTRILVVDSSKFGAVHTAHFADLEDFSMVITDSGIPQAYEGAIRAAGMGLHIV